MAEQVDRLERLLRMTPWERLREEFGFAPEEFEMFKKELTGWLRYRQEGRHDDRP